MENSPYRPNRPTGPRRPGATGAYNGPGKGRPFTARPSGPRRDGDGDRPTYGDRPGYNSADRPRYGAAGGDGRADRFSARDRPARPARDDDFTDYERDRTDDGPGRRTDYTPDRDRHADRHSERERGPAPDHSDRPVRPAQYSKTGPPPGRKPTWSPRPEGPGKDELIFGIRPVQEALLAGQVLERVFVQRELKSPLGADVLEAARRMHVPVQEVPIEKLNALTRKTHQGVVALLAVIEYSPLDEVIAAAFEAGRTPLVVVLDRVTDVRNFGSIARSAECLGADALLIATRGGAQINGDAVKTSAGALSRLPVCREPNLKDALRYLVDAGLRVVACTEKADKTLGQAGAPDLSGPLALILGSEEDGISPEYLRLADAEVKIPILGHIGSLNVGVAAGVALFEVQRQRQL